jgi:polygalacturonase
MNNLCNTALFLLMLSIVACSKSKDGTYNVLDFGAKGDSISMDKTAIQKAIDDAHKNGGGTVILPAPGKYRTGTIWLKDNVTLDIQGGATIYGSGDLADYDSMRWGHNDDRCPYHLIIARNASNVTIQGQGTIDGLGWNWYEHTDVKPRWMKKQTPRPSPMVEFENCKDVKVRDVLLTNAAGWTLHAFNSNQVHINGIRLINNLYGPNNDGIDITGCTNVMISDCYVKTCDDAVCLKTTDDSNELHNVTVTNCTMQTTCVALKLGETAKDMSDVTFSNCAITQSSRAFGIYATWGGDVENVMVSNIVCNTNAPLVLNRPFQIAAWDQKSAKTGEIIRKGGNVKNVIVSNFIATTEGRILINANDGHSIENITLRDIKLNYPYIEDAAIYGPYATSNQFRGIDSTGMVANAAVVISNASNIAFDGLDISWPKTNLVPESWRHPERIENGKFDKVHYPEYDDYRNPAYHAVYLSNVQGGYIFAPMVTASSPPMKPIAINDSFVKLMGLKE